MDARELTDMIDTYRNSTRKTVAVPKNVKDMTGMRFGRLTVIRYAGPYHTGPCSHTCALWECECDCGTRTWVPRTSLVKGNTRSCGCLNREKNLYRKEHHGRERDAEG